MKIKLSYCNTTPEVPRSLHVSGQKTKLNKNEKERAKKKAVQ
jgi:hypothetical protein